MGNKLNKKEIKNKNIAVANRSRIIKKNRICRLTSPPPIFSHHSLSNKILVVSSLFLKIFPAVTLENLP